MAILMIHANRGAIGESRTPPWTNKVETRANHQKTAILMLRNRASVFLQEVTRA
jgi:hypothetical protein